MLVKLMYDSPLGRLDEGAFVRDSRTVLVDRPATPHREQGAWARRLPHAQSALARASATLGPSSAALGATRRPYDFMISVFSAALSPSAEMIAPAWPMRRPFGAVSPAT